MHSLWMHISFFSHLITSYTKFFSQCANPAVTIFRQQSQSRDTQIVSKTTRFFYMSTFQMSLYDLLIEMWWLLLRDISLMANICIFVIIYVVIIKKYLFESPCQFNRCFRHKLKISLLTAFQYFHYFDYQSVIKTWSNVTLCNKGTTLVFCFCLHFKRCWE